jgi:hypothetical protein
MATPTFRIEILSPAILRSLVESVAQVLTQARFMVVDTDEFSGLRLNAMDDTTICMYFVCYVQYSVNALVCFDTTLTPTTLLRHRLC